MSDVFVFLLNKAITAGWVIIAVLVLRLLLHRAPRRITCLMWGVVGLRLLLPVSLQSVCSLIPSASPVPPNIALSQTPAVHTGIESFNMAVNPMLYEAFAPTLENSVNPLQVVLTVAAWVWAIGAAAMLMYAVVAYIRLARRVRVSLPLEDGVFVCDRVDTPFIFGIIKPRIFLPSDIAKETAALVIAHEKAHLQRRDHLIKPLGFLLLAVYWFHPLVWVGYLLLCRDIETACDEKVVKALDTEGRCAYSAALVECNTHRRVAVSCPLAFGEVGVKTRVKAVLNYKKPAFWLLAAAVIACVAVAVCFLTDPRENELNGVTSQRGGSDLSGVSLRIVSAELAAPDPYLTVEWHNSTATEILYGEPFSVYYKQDGGWVDCRLQDTVWSMPAYNVRPFGTREKIYRLHGLSMYIAGEYRLEATFSAGDTEHTAWVEFTLGYGVEQVAALNFEAETLWYAPPNVSFVMTADMAPDWGLVNGTMLYEYGKDGLVAMLGYMQPIELNDENFFSPMDRLWADEGAPSISAIYKNNKHAWQLYNGNLLYILLEQQDGTYFLAYGTHSMQAKVTWLFQLKKKEYTPDMSQPIVNGAIVFYRATTEEHYTAVYDTYCRLSSAELSALLETLEAEQWVYDGLVDRTAFHFDGKMWCQGKWLYFGYKEKIVCYGEHFANVSDKVIEQLRNAQNRAEPFKGR